MDDPQLRETRAGSFGANAALYAEHRPGYPVDAVEWAIGDRVRVLDLGAGTGKLTEALLELGVDVTAVEPDPLMRAELARRLPDVPTVDGRAEAIPLGDASVDAVLAGQAFHWFDNAEALAEITRVLRPGGVFGALWNAYDDSVPWVKTLVSLTATSVSNPSAPAPRHVPRHELLGEVEENTFKHQVLRTVDSMVGSLRTFSHIAVAPDDEREAVLAKAQEYLSGLPDSRGTFYQPLLCEVVRAVRR
ncbi:class I SAM-dependent methyltransferase [Actinokineospora guangxiensis]|uniref:Class I SAM-dependent methyltransferase n=1 Tax=Actinokineospora guangxiensis TaxID=1490288 RepID=A0ABW0EKL6_9PSEU